MGVDMRLSFDEGEGDAPPPDVEVAVMPTLRIYSWIQALRREIRSVSWSIAEGDMSS